MPRLSHWTLSSLTILSLLLCVATAALWPRSYFASDELTYSLPKPSPSGEPPDPGDYRYHGDWRAYSAITARGSIGFFIFDDWFAPAPGAGRWHYFVQRPAHDVRLSAFLGKLGFDFRRTVPSPDSIDPTSASAPVGDVFMMPHLIVPFWFLFAISAILPTRAGHHWLRYRRNARAGFLPILTNRTPTRSEVPNAAGK